MIEKLTLFTLLSVALSPTTSEDPLASLPDERIDLELKDAPIGDVMMLVESISGDTIELDACVEGTLSLQLSAVTLRSFLEVVGDTLSLTYSRSDDGALQVGCAEKGPDRRNTRVDISVVATPMTNVLDVLSQATDMPIAASGCDDVLVDINASNAPASAVLYTIASQAAAKVELEDGGLQVRCEA